MAINTNGDEPLVLVTKIIAHLSDAEINVVWEACNARMKQIRVDKSAEVASTLEVGDTVTLTGLRPQYLNDTECEVLEIKAGGKVRVKAHESGTDYRFLRRFAGGIVTVPMSCVEIVG